MTLTRISTFILASFLLAGCFGGNPDSKPVSVNTGKDGDILETQSFQTTMRTGNQLIDEDHGTEIALWYGGVSGIGNVNANGIGFTHKFDDGYFVHTLNVNIKQAGTGYYVAWAAKDAAGTDARRLGVLANLVGDVRHSVRFETKDDLSAHLHVFVTQETEKEPATPGQKVAEATLKLVQK